MPQNLTLIKIMCMVGMIRSCIWLDTCFSFRRVATVLDRGVREDDSQDLKGGSREADACQNRYSLYAPAVESTLEGNSVSVGWGCNACSMQTGFGGIPFRDVVFLRFVWR